MIYALAITGPTASGKTGLSLELAKRLSAEIISADSMQIYRGMDIGTAKATAAERAEVAHHMIDFLPPHLDYSVESYRAAALDAARDIVSRSKLPIFVGGTGLYMNALMRAPMAEVPESSREYRDKAMADIRSERDVHALWERLNSIDPESAAAIHENNTRRVIRALEIYDMTGKTKSYFDRLSKEAAPDIRIGMITLDYHDRETLYSRVDKRVDIMIADGLVDEVSRLVSTGALKKDSTAAQAIGYKEIVKYIEGELTLGEAIELIKLSTRRYAKRQLTWFRHCEGAARLYMDTEIGALRDPSDVLSEALSVTENFINLFGKEQ